MSRKVFITGAYGGIGQVVAQTYIDAGYEVVMPSHQELDLANSFEVEQYIQNHKDDEYDIMIFCAGINRKAELENIKYSDMIDTYQVNVFSSIQLLSHYVKLMKDNRYGKIIFVSSLYATVSKELRCNYSGTKSAINGVIHTLALELAPYEICVNAVAPGYVMTKMTKKNLSESEIDEIIEMIPTHRMQEAQEIADIIYFLTSDKNKSITGQLISVDGGFLCK